LKLTFLGTGTSQGVPVIACNCEVCKSDDGRDKRLRASVMLQTDTTTVVIDSGPDFRQQMLREKVTSLDGILITHQHKDHIAGLDDVRAFNYVQKKSMNVYGNSQVTEAIKREFAYSFSADKYPGVPEINLITITHPHFYVNDLLVTPIHVMHLKLPIYAYRIKNITYITDASFISEPEKQKIYGTEILVVNALRIQKHISHFNLDQALELIQQIKPGKAYLTHISHQMGLHNTVNAQLPENVFLAYDGLSIQC